MNVTSYINPVTSYNGISQLLDTKPQAASAFCWLNDPMILTYPKGGEVRGHFYYVPFPALSIYSISRYLRSHKHP